MKQCYATGYEAKETQVNVVYDSKYGFNYKHERIHWRLEDSGTDVKRGKLNILVLKGCFQSILVPNPSSKMGWLI